MPKPIRVLLVDDHEIVRLGLMTLINDQDNMEVVGEAGSASEAMLKVEQLQPDVVLMDIRLPGQSGIQASRVISERFPQTKVVVLTSYTDDTLVLDAIRAGAVGYVLKHVGNQELLRAISAAARGEASLDPGATARLISHFRATERKAQEDAFRGLSEREMDVLVEVARGKTNAEIGHILNLQEKTVRNYVSSVLEKLGFSNRIELAIYAVQNRIFESAERK
ncbi:MAG TPA: response regulator transcription factor [Anaerolineales bacterium]|nr:response regulator transcription factor [Anaerolineales bacterium]